jgi:hypothetical protein
MTPFLHLSVDDVLPGLITASDRGGALSNDPMIGALDRLHDEFGMQMDLYLFGESGGRRLEDVSSAVARELQARPWLRLGPHAADIETPPHRQTLADLDATLRRLFAAIEPLAGPASRSTWLRLHEFSEAYEAAPLLAAHGVEVLLTTDKPAVAWRLPTVEREVLARRGRVPFGGIEFVRSHLRVEWLVAESIDRAALSERICRIVDAHGFLVVFTHEVCFDDPRTAAMFHELLDVCRALGIRTR